MKFLCVPCDSQMSLRTIGPPERGSLSVVYSCPECGYEIAMLTNAYETQVVQSLGVRIGPGLPGDNAQASQGEASVAASRTGSGQAGCPFAAMIPAEAAADETGQGVRPGSEHVAAESPVRWTAGAEARLEKVPSFVRPMARAGIEQFAREQGSLEVNERILDQAREFFGM